MPSDGAKLLDAYRKLDTLLVSKGAPATSPAWLAALESFWLSGRFRMVVRKGRQVGASTIIAPRIAVATCLFGVFDQARGTRGTYGFFSTRQKEADERLYNIERTFADAGVKVKPKGDTIEVPGKPVVIQSFPATTEVGRGPNWWAVWEDEMPAWADGDGANPAEKRDGAIVPACIMHDNARAYSIGTPLGHLDFHARLVDLGDTESQRVFVGPSWHWNPTLTEAKTRTLQPNERLWLREFAAVPQSANTAVFDPKSIERAMQPRPAGVSLVEEQERVLVIDASRGKDSWTWAIVRWTVEATDLDPAKLGPAPNGDAWCWPVHARPVLAWDSLTGERTTTWERQTVRGEWLPFDAEAAAARRAVLEVEGIGEVPDGADTEGAIAFLATIARKRRQRGFNSEPVRKVLHDQYEAGAMGVLLRRAGLRPIEEKWSAPSKERAVDRMERLFRDDAIRLPKHETLRRQLGEYSEKITKSGGIAYGGSGRHDDYAQVLVTAAMGDVSGVLPGSPFRRSAHRYEIPG